MYRHFRMVLAAGLILGLSPALANERIRNFEYPGAQRTGFLGVNDRGQILGAAIVGSDAYPFLLDIRANELTNLVPIPGNVLYLVNGLNNDKVLVGELYDNDLDTAVAFIQQPDGSYTTFSHPKARTITGATAINERGLVTGIRDRRNGGFAGFLYNIKTGRFQNIVAGQSLEPNGINRHGVVVGRVVVLRKDDPCGGGPSGSDVLLYGFVRHKGGLITLFQVNREQTYGGDITDDGQVVGSVYDPPAGKSRIFVVSVPRERCVFLKVPRDKLIGTPGIEYVVGGVTDGGKIVGTAHEFSPPDVNTLRGFIATPLR
jgi:hypothetical protein